MTARRVLQVVLFLVALGVLLMIGGVTPQLPRRSTGKASPAMPVPRAAPPAPTAAPATGPQKAAVENSPTLSGYSDIAADLNAPGGTIRRDLEILNEVLVTFQTNFPRTGNPVGENAEITAALLGDNLHRFAFIRPGHRAVSSRGELVDRWGTPFRFHQLSGTQMEIRSAGPDRRFGTPDDAEFAPGAPVPVPR